MANPTYPINKIVKASNGNPGAMNAIMQMSAFHLDSTIDKLIDNEIIGTDLYVLFSDLCGKSPFMVEKLVNSDCPIEILKDACSRQDYSGRVLVAKYLNY